MPHRSDNLHETAWLERLSEEPTVSLGRGTGHRPVARTTQASAPAANKRKKIPAALDKLPLTLVSAEHLRRLRGPFPWKRRGIVIRPCCGMPFPRRGWSGESSFMRGYGDSH